MTAQELATFVSVGAATLAAVLAGVNLWVTGRRAHLAWTRSALEQSFVVFLTVHYDHWDACSNVARLLSGEPSHRTAKQLVARAREADAEMMRCITRFRVLASESLAKTALELYGYNPPTCRRSRSGMSTRWSQRAPNSARTRRKRVRDTFVRGAQAVLSVRQ